MGPEGFEIIGRIRQVETIAAGKGVRVRGRLKKKFGGSRWRKMKGVAVVREDTGETYEAEIHWYEAHGVGKRDWKIKGPPR